MLKTTQSGLAENLEIREINMTKLTTNEARQGESGHHVRWILGVSLTLAILALAVLFGMTGS